MYAKKNYTQRELSTEHPHDHETTDLADQMSAYQRWIYSRPYNPLTLLFHDK